ncbi:hypothetical protein ACTSKR_09630 [Chitinibacteraceae bacterium HSL-7]
MISAADLQACRLHAFTELSSGPIDALLADVRADHDQQGQIEALLLRGEFRLRIATQTTAAQKDFRDAALLARSMQHWSLLAQALHWQAQAQLEAGEYMRALDIWLQALQVALDGNDHAAFIRGYSGIAQVCLVYGQTANSNEYQRRALELARHTDDVQLRIDCLLAYIASCHQLDLMGEMTASLEELAEELKHTVNLESQAEFFIYQAMLLLHADRLQEAGEILEVARALAQHHGGSWCRAFAALTSGKVARRAGLLEDARIQLEHCLTLGAGIPGFSMFAEAHSLLEDICIEQNDFEGALEHLGYSFNRQMAVLQKQAQRKLQRISQRQLKDLELALRLELGRMRYQ